MSGEPTNVIPFTVRPMQPADRRFVRETTLKVRMPRGGNWTEYEAAHGAALDRALGDGSCSTVVADAGGELVLGFATRGNDPPWTLSMVYVKRELRGCAVGLALLGTLGGRDWGNPMFVLRPTPSFRKWAALHRIAWTTSDE